MGIAVNFACTQLSASTRNRLVVQFRGVSEKKPGLQQNLWVVLAVSRRDGWIF